MLSASENIPMNVYFMIPSCVPATAFENSGASLGAEEIEKLIDNDRVLGLGELMDYPSVIEGKPEILEKILTAEKRGKIIDGHGPMLVGKEANAYAAAGVRTDHECSTVDEMNDRLSNGMYVLLREGSAARNLRALLKGVTSENSRRCAFCTDDRQPEDLIEYGHIDNHLRIAVEEGIDPITAIQMATINAAECYKLEKPELYRRGTGLILQLLIISRISMFWLPITGEKKRRKTGNLCSGFLKTIEMFIWER